ncbi:hypothetical protein Calag_1251 [Caldisphaera lagunensis DSM 15908]|uniref:Archaeal flagellin-like protein n=1 Tax=Caldisphaera lagunensis (strain DSM 15908 / JCM 11604 / ANMR 0165 / IC-154) TaxID=1056495 RepID=L0AAM5_CALLD|nr:hypothetical protein [Caldisphaera lagunensis]AFZ70968.1 hypothetical protein Calag_1251 [Caldisphaera lagunensis DSM 15908]
MRKNRAVSNIVAEIMMILITLAIGFTLIVYLSSAAGGFISLTNSNNNQAQISLQQYIVPMGSYISNGNLYFIFNSGPMGAQINSVYINNTLINSCSILFNKTSYSLPHYIPPDAVAIIKCTNVKSLPSIITVAYSGGEVYAMANPS